MRLQVSCRKKIDLSVSIIRNLIYSSIEKAGKTEGLAGM